MRDPEHARRSPRGLISAGTAVHDRHDVDQPPHSPGRSPGRRSLPCAGTSAKRAGFPGALLMTRSALPGLGIALAILAAGLITAFTVGRYPVSLAELTDVLAAHLTGRPSSVAPAVENVILLVRGPRVLAAVLIGAALAVAGTAFQGLFRNPLVSPDILGASSGAALGAVLGIFFSARRLRHRKPRLPGRAPGGRGRLSDRLAVARQRPDPGPGADRRGDRRAARRRRRVGEISRRPLQPAPRHDVLAARQPRQHHGRRPPAARRARSCSAPPCWWRCAGA